ncbi:MAG: ABC transporter permease [Candidatus Kerfeldbacteria bacterium]|nr:ABC transporter permease [Candidatus Kerfeldbacteria bacterium]
MFIKLLQNIKLALQAVWAKKIRSLLTMLGVIIGVFSIVTLIALGEGVQQEVTGQIEGLGSNLLFVTPGNIDPESAGATSGSAFVGASTLTESDLPKLESLPGVKHVVPMALLASPVSATMPINGAAGGTPGSTPSAQSAAMVMGSTIAVREAFTGQVTEGEEYGRMFTQEEYDSAARVVVGFSGAMEKLFPGRPISELINETVYIGKEKFTVVGLLQADQSSSMFGQSEFSNIMIIPFTTAKEISASLQINRIIITSQETENVQDLQNTVEATLLESHEGVDDFSVLTQEDLLAVFNDVLGVITGMLSGIAAISLLVGGIGVMNIMLVSVTERVKEIGLRKAIGASSYDILIQFLVEAMFLTFLGGAIGIGLAFITGFILEAKIGLSPIISIETMLLAFVFTALVGVFFGVAPAIRAARLDPINALKYE